MWGGEGEGERDLKSKINWAGVRNSFNPRLRKQRPTDLWVWVRTAWKQGESTRLCSVNLSWKLKEIEKRKERTWPWAPGTSVLSKVSAMRPWILTLVGARKGRPKTFDYGSLLYFILFVTMFSMWTVSEFFLCAKPNLNSEFSVQKLKEALLSAWVRQYNPHEKKNNRGLSRKLVSSQQ